MFKMLQHVWSQSQRPKNMSVVCLSWCMTTCTGWLFLSECSASLLWQSIVVFTTELHGTSPTTAYWTSLRSSWAPASAICQMSSTISSEFAAAILGPVHFVSPEQQSRIHSEAAEASEKWAGQTPSPFPLLFPRSLSLPSIPSPFNSLPPLLALEVGPLIAAKRYGGVP